MRMKVVAGLNGAQLAVICESQGVKTSLSERITLTNKMRRIEILSEIREQQFITFEEENSVVQQTSISLSKELKIKMVDSFNRPLKVEENEISIGIL